jgi:multidrug efflux pump subunit AcrA (membrane-fusion protein)
MIMISQYKQYKHMTQAELDAIKALAQAAKPSNERNQLEQEKRLLDAAKLQRTASSIVLSLVEEVERLRDEMELEAESEAGLSMNLPAIGSRVYKAQPLLGVVYGDVAGIEVYDNGRIMVKFREIGFAPTSYGGFWMVDTFPTETEARAALKNASGSNVKNMPAPVEYGAPFDEPFYVEK